MEKHLRDQGIYSSNYIRPQLPSHKRKGKIQMREIPFSEISNDSEEWDLLAKQDFKGKISRKIRGIFGISAKE